MDALAQAIKSAVREVIDEKIADLTTSAEPRLMSISNAARYLDCSPNYVRAMISRNILRQVQFDASEVRQKVFVDRKDLDALIEENKRRGTDAA